MAQLTNTKPVQHTVAHVCLITLNKKKNDILNFYLPPDHPTNNPATHSHPVAHSRQADTRNLSAVNTSKKPLTWREVREREREEKSVNKGINKATLSIQYLLMDG